MTKQPFVPILHSLMETPTTIRISALVAAGLWCAAFILAPLLKTEAAGVSSFLYGFFSGVCHQFPDRSFHLSGEPLAVCIRCSSLYISGLLSLSIIAAGSVRDSPPRWVLAAAVTPMLIDVIMNLTGVHQSTLWTRAATGAIAGLALPFYVIPPLVESISQIKSRIGGVSHAGKTR